MGSHKATSWIRGQRCLQRVVSIAAILLVLGCELADTADTCPEHFTCHWEGDVFVLNCKLANDTLPSKMAVVTSADLPVTATCMKIVCDRQDVEMQLELGHLVNITELTLDGVVVNTYGTSNISHLVLRNLPWKKINYDYFQSLTNLRSLTLDHLGRLEYIDSGALKPLVSLESLSFLYIALPYSNYFHVLRGIESPTFQTLVLHDIDSSDKVMDISSFFENWSRSDQLKRVDVANNRIYRFNLDLQTLPRLEHLSLTGNIIYAAYFVIPRSVGFFISHKHLKTIYVTGVESSMSKPPLRPLCTISVSTNVSSLQLPYLPIERTEVGSRMESISFNGAKFIEESVIVLEYPDRGAGIHVSDPSNVLKYIDLSNFKTSSCITIAFVGCRAVEYFNIQNVRSVELNVFKQMPNLTVLLLGNNDLNNVVASNNESRLFSENTKLKVLDLSGCQLTEVPTYEFSYLHDLQQLNLSRNSLEQFQIDLHNLSELRFLNLSDNNLKTLSVGMRAQLDQMTADRNVQVDISRNPLQCTCNDTGFVSWIHKSRVIFHNKDNTLCVDRQSTMLHLFNIDTEELGKDCNPDTYQSSSIMPTTQSNSDNHGDKSLATYLIPATIIFVLIASVLCVARYYRWKCAYAWNRFKKCTTLTDVQLDEVVYDRDAFICYNSNDSGWVCHDLLDHLDSSGISTVIHHRDFLPGSVLEEMIRESIDRSRFTVLVLSPDFLASNWCRLEMHIARNRIISEGRDVIVPIILREFPTSQVTRTLAGILTKSYLQWTDDPEGQALFWDKLITKLKHGGNLRPLEN